MDKQAYPLDRVHCLLEPGPVLLVSTASGGRHDLMCMSWHTMMEFSPPLVGCVLSRGNDSFALFGESEECVLNIPDASLLDAVVGVGNSHGHAVDKFAAFGLTPLPAAQVAAPLVAECCASLECRVVDRELASRYDFFVLEVLQAWYSPERMPPRTLHHCGWGEFMIAGERRQTDSRMR